MKPLSELPPTKICNKCGTEHPRTTEFFMPYVGRSVDGMRAICRTCERVYKREAARKYAAKRKEKAG